MKAVRIIFVCSILRSKRTFFLSKIPLLSIAPTGLILWMIPLGLGGWINRTTACMCLIWLCAHVFSEENEACSRTATLVFQSDKRRSGQPNIEGGGSTSPFDLLFICLSYWFVFSHNRIHTLVLFRWRLQKWLIQWEAMAAAALLPGCYSVALTGPLQLSIPGSICTSIHLYRLVEMLHIFENVSKHIIWVLQLEDAWFISIVSNKMKVQLPHCHLTLIICTSRFNIIGS